MFLCIIGKTPFPIIIFLVAVFLCALDDPFLSLFTIWHYFFLLIYVVLDSWIVIRYMDVHFLQRKLLRQHFSHLTNDLYLLRSLCYVSLCLLQQIAVLLPQEQDLTF